MRPFDEIIMDFNPKNYEKINDKYKLYSELNESFADKIGIPPQYMSYIETEDQAPLAGENKIYGRNDSKKNIIQINLFHYKNPYTIMATIMHETLHMYLDFVVKYNIHKENIDDLQLQEYERKIKRFFKCKNFAAGLLMQKFKTFTKEINLTQNYNNILYLDKIYRYFISDIQPYFYNVDSHELIAEYETQKIILEILKDMDDNDKDAILAIREYASENDYLDNGDINLKRIYIEQNATSRWNILALYKIIESIKRKINLFNPETYDVEEYMDLYKKAYTNITTIRAGKTFL